MSVDLSWASPELRDRIAADPFAVLADRGWNPPAGMPLAVVHEFLRVAHLLWVDGQTVPIDQFSIDPSDEGLLFGRGVWESTRTIGGLPWLWPLHLDRILESAGILGISLSRDRLPDEQRVAEWVRSLTSQDVVIRLNASAGRPGKPGLVWMSAAPMSVRPESMALRSVVNPVQKGQPYLLLKTFQYATRLRINQGAARDGFDMALIVDSAGNLMEASHANLFVRFPDGWATPAVDGGFLPGTVRHILVQKSPLPIREMTIPKSRLPEISEAFVTNSNLGIVPVRRIDDRELPLGSETVSLQRWLEPPPPPGVQYRFAERNPTPR